MNRLSNFIFFLLFSFAFSAWGQNEFAVPALKQLNYTSFTEDKVILSEDLNNLSSEKSKTHPEYGKLPFNAPCTDCFELIEKRTANTRYFVKENSNKGTFYSNSSWSDLHYKNINSEWITIDYRLKPTNETGVYRASQQPGGTTLNLVDGYTAIEMFDGSQLKFNQHITIYNSNNPDEPNKIKSINRSNFTVGDDGAYVTNVFDGIDQVLMFGKAKVKSSYVLNNLNEIKSDKTYFVVVDEFELPTGYKIVKDTYEGAVNNSGFWHGELVIENADGMEMARFKKPIVFDGDTSDMPGNISREDISGYLIEQVGNICRVKTVVLNVWMTNPERIFPITIDPTVFGTTTTWSGTSGADDSPTFCSVTLAVPTPADATLTGSEIHWEYRALGNAGTCGGGGCKIKHLQVRVCTTCDCSPTPAGVWVGVTNAGGLWIPTIDDASTKDLVECFTPQCTPFNIDFTIYFNQFSCVTAGGCVLDCSYLEELQVTIEGKTVEATATAAGGTAYTVVDCADQSDWLSPDPDIYGVPGYTYSWSPIGSTDADVYVTFPLGVTVYTLTITDACGNVVTDNVTVTNNCLLLPLNLNDFSGYYESGYNYLSWVSTAENTDHFIVERSLNGKEFTEIGKISNQTIPGSLNYAFNDPSPSVSTVYYRLKQIKTDLQAYYSDIIAIKTDFSSPNTITSTQFDPSTGLLGLETSVTSASVSQLNIYDLSGKLVFTNQITLNEGINFISTTLPALSAGAYVVQVVLPESTLESKFVY